LFLNSQLPAGQSHEDVDSFAATKVHLRFVVHPTSIAFVLGFNAN